MTSHVCMLAANSGGPAHCPRAAWPFRRRVSEPSSTLRAPIKSEREAARSMGAELEVTVVSRNTAWPPGTPCWVDLGVTDIPKARTFYSSLFGWEIQDTPPEAGGYSMCVIGGRPVAGIGQSEGDMPIFWTTYLASDDADKTAEAIKTAGGRVVVEPFDVMDVGRMLIAA